MYEYRLKNKQLQLIYSKSALRCTFSNFLQSEILQLLSYKYYFSNFPKNYRKYMGNTVFNGSYLYQNIFWSFYFDFESNKHSYQHFHRCLKLIGIVRVLRRAKLFFMIYEIKSKYVLFLVYSYFIKLQ